MINEIRVTMYYFPVAARIIHHRHGCAKLSKCGIAQLWTLAVQNGSHRTKPKGQAGLHWPGDSGENPLACFSAFRWHEFSGSWPHSFTFKANSLDCLSRTAIFLVLLPLSPSSAFKEPCDHTAQPDNPG